MFRRLLGNLAPLLDKNASIATMTPPAFSLTIMENALSISRGVRTCTGRILMPLLKAAVWTLFKIIAWVGLTGFDSTATRDNLGTMLSNISKCLARVCQRGSSPVIFPPGRARLLTNPMPTGSPM